MKLLESAVGESIYFFKRFPKSFTMLLLEAKKLLFFVFSF